ncbi:MAG: ATP-binding protein, partial [Bacilli bacterium]
MNSIEKITLLEDKYFNGRKKLDVFKKYGKAAAITDFAILSGGLVSYMDYTSDGNNFEDRSCDYLIRTSDGLGKIIEVNCNSHDMYKYIGRHSDNIRPALLYSSICNAPNVVRRKSGVLEVEYGEYPQQAVQGSLNRTLESEYKRRGLRSTGKEYTTDSRNQNEYYKDFRAKKNIEYEYNGKKYARVVARLYFSPTILSNGISVSSGDVIWVEIQPITWLIDEKEYIALAKKGLIGGISFYKDCDKFVRSFDDTEINMFLQTYFIKDIIPSDVHVMTSEVKKECGKREKKLEKNRNPYGLNFDQVSEEQIIRGAIESGVPVFLHGASSEGKSARVKQIDPTCEIIYLRNATPESLNGKSVYNSATGEMKDIAPTWLKKLQEKCEKEPDRQHIVFLDEITNALPSIQGMAFNIVLDREVNGMWKLPDNARIVAAGNDMKDSLAANQLAEPLFNRFAHVYIKTSTESWLKWASDNNIHPAIYSYIAYKRGETLRSKYDGEKPNADPRKWEMASKMLYKTGSPEMLRSLIGEDITKEFVQFCNQRIITIEDVVS